MTLLVDYQIKSRACEDKTTQDKEALVIAPFDNDCLAPNGYYLRVGGVATGGDDSLEEGGYIEIPKGVSVLIEVMEFLRMPKCGDLSGFIQSRLDLATKGLSNISTVVDHDWAGKLKIVVTNMSQNTIRLKRGEKLCRIVFHSNSACPAQPSNKASYVNELTDLFKARKRRERINWIKKTTFYLTVSCVGAVIGWVLFENGTGLAAMTALSIALANFIVPVKR